MKVILFMSSLCSLVGVVLGLKCIVCSGCHLTNIRKEEVLCDPINQVFGGRSVCESRKFNENGTVFDQRCGAFGDGPGKMGCFQSTRAFTFIVYNPSTTVDPTLPNTTTITTTTIESVDGTSSTEEPTTTKDPLIRLNLTVAPEDSSFCHCDVDLCVGSAGRPYLQAVFQKMFIPFLIFFNY